MTNIYSASDVAKYFIYLSSKNIIGDNEEREGITNLKLQKILYLAQAYFLAKLNRALFNDEISAWTYGPVISSIYHLYKSNGNMPIIDIEDKSKVSEEDKLILDQIWDSFGSYSARKLVDITHAHAPWRDAYSTKSKIISNSSIKEYYKPLIGN